MNRNRNRKRLTCTALARLRSSTPLGPSSTTGLACRLGPRHLGLGTNPQAGPDAPSGARRPTAPRRRLLRLGVAQRVVEGAAAKGA